MSVLKYSTQTIVKRDIESLNKVLRSEYLTQGPKTIEFEKKIKFFVGSKYALVTNSGSSALLLACKALSIKPGEIFWTVPNSFVASANCGILCGLKVDFIDIDPDTYNMNPELIADGVEYAYNNCLTPKAIIPVDFRGYLALLPAIKDKIG